MAFSLPTQRHRSCTCCSSTPTTHNPQLSIPRSPRSSTLAKVFAKEDMDSAGIALSEKDEAEAIDAQEYIVETLEGLRGKVDAVVPQYRYILEMVEALHETMQEGILIREAQRRLREQASAEAAEPALFVKEQGELKARAEAYGKLINEITGLGVFVSLLM